MSKDVLFRVELSFSSEVVSDEEIMEVARNIAESLEHSAGTAGIAPEDSDAYTEHIRVTPWFLNKTVTISIK